MPFPSPRSSGKPVMMAWAALLTAICGGPLLGGCSANGGSPSLKEASPKEASPSAMVATSTAAPATHPAASPSDTAAPDSGLRLKVQNQLETLLRSSPQPSRNQVKDALERTGTAPSAIEVSASSTPTGLAADSLTAGVLSGKQCVMAQVRSGSVTTVVLPVLSNGRCFVGDDLG